MAEDSSTRREARRRLRFAALGSAWPAVLSACDLLQYLGPPTGRKSGAPNYPPELYMQLYPSLFPPPTVAQATAGTDLVWKYHPRLYGTAFMSLSQFQQYQTREIDRAVFNEKINEKMRQCEQGAN